MEQSPPAQNGDLERKAEAHHALTRTIIRVREEAFALGMTDREISSAILSDLADRHPELRDIVLEDDN